MDFAKTRWISDINKDLPKFVEDPSKPSWFFDCEVFRNDWMFCFERFDSDEKVVIVNDYDKLVDFIYNRCYILIGYNSNFYDIAILKAVLLKQNVFEISCQMIDDGITVYFSQNNIVPPTWDLLQPTMAGVLGAFCSLKAAEIYFYHVPAVETSVDFMTQDKLTPKQIEETIKYCQTDVSYTKRLFFDTRLKHELESQRMLCDAYNLPYTQYLHRSEAFITNKLLGKKNNAPQLAAYLLPDNSDGFIRSDIYQFYKDHELDLELPSYTNIIGGLECSFGVGGLHGALLQYQNPEGVNIIDVDVTSMYPSIMIKHGIFSRNSVGLQAFEDIFNTRVALKKAKDPKQSAYKLILNATYGSMGSKFYEFADPMMRTTVCIYGQLYITALMEMLHAAGYKLVQVNTDGVMFEDNGTDDWKDICKKWEERTKLGLESIVYTHFYQRDVNNYRAVSEWGDVTNRGIFNATTNQPPFISKLLPKLLDNTLSEDITEGLEVWDFVHILSVKGSRLSLRANGEVVPGKTHGVIPCKPEFGPRLTWETVDKNDKHDLERKISYITHGILLTEEGFPENWREMLDRDAIMEELRNSFAPVTENYVILNDDFQPDAHGNRISINPLTATHVNDKYANCKNVQRRNLMFEFDHKSYEEQLKYLEKNKEIISRAIFTGNKSIHFIVSLECSIASEERYRQIWDYYNETYFDGEADPGTRSSHVYTRIPGKLNANGNKQVLLYESLSSKVSEASFGGRQYTNCRKIMTKKQTEERYDEVIAEFCEGNRYLVVKELMKAEYTKYIGIDKIMEDLNWCVRQYGVDKSVHEAIRFLKKLRGSISGTVYTQC